MCRSLLTANSFYIVSLHGRSVCCHHWTVKLLSVVCVCIFVKTKTITFNKQGSQILWLANYDKFSSSACIPKGENLKQ